MKIKSIKTIKLNNPEPVYDVINVEPYHNFLIKGNTCELISHNCAILDEINFAAGQDVSMEKSKIMKTYAAINTRITNRFRVEGNVHGKLFMVSSKKSEYDFLEQYAQKMKNQSNFYIVDDKVWNIVPPEKTGYSGKMFNLAIGGDILPSKIIPDNENPEEYIKQGYEIMQVPIEEKQKFVLDMERSLMDIAAVSISYVTKFLNYNIISQCYCDDTNPFSQEIISTGIHDALEIKEFFNLNLIPQDIRKKPTFIHIDTSLTGDRTGIGAVCMLGKDKIEKFDMQANKIIKTYQTIYKHIFNVEIQCPKNSEISFQKTRNFIIYLRQCGFNICGITLDGFQCLLKGTLIKTFNGDKAIENLKENDKILAYDSKNNTYVWTSFINLSKTAKTNKKYRIKTTDGKIIECTANHKILTTRGYVCARNLCNNDKIIKYVKEDE